LIGDSVIDSNKLSQSARLLHTTQQNGASLSSASRGWKASTHQTSGDISKSVRKQVKPNKTKTSKQTSKQTSKPSDEANKRKQNKQNKRNRQTSKRSKQADRDPVVLLLQFLRTEICNTTAFLLARYNTIQIQYNHNRIQAL
jgi:hypothetical protein